jgi:hypothetical protein
LGIVISKSLLALLHHSCFIAVFTLHSNSVAGGGVSDQNPPFLSPILYNFVPSPYVFNSDFPPANEFKTFLSH